MFLTLNLPLDEEFKISQFYMRVVVLSLCAFLFITACNNDPLEVDVSGIDVDIEFKRFDRDLFSEREDLSKHVAFLNETYGGFYKNFTQMIPSLGHAEDPAHIMYLEPFLFDPGIKEINDAIAARYDDLESVEEEFEEAWKHYIYHFPNRNVPEMIAFNSALNASPLVNDTQMGVGLDLFLGVDFPLYASVQYPMFLRQRMKPELMVYNSMRGWLISEFPKEEGSKSLLDNMVYAGKILYAMDAVFPGKGDSLKIEFTAAQLDWAERFESNVWGLFIDKGILFSKDRSEIGPFLNDGPFSSGLAKESPPRIGEWIGWQMVRSYMDKYPETSLEELMSLQDAQKIMQKSAYRPN